MDDSFRSGVHTLACHIKEPTADSHDGKRTGMILCHGFPIGPIDARRSAGTYPQLIDRIAYETGYAAMAFNFRGCGKSTGDFSLQGWIDDLRAAIDHLLRVAAVSNVVLVGTNTGGSIAICVGADDPRVSAAALLSPRADFDDWADHPRRFLDHAREIGAVRTPGFPGSMDDWSRAFRRFRPTAAARRFAPRPLIVLHGDDDESIPTTDARQLAQAHGTAELGLLTGAGHRLRHDPRAIAILMGWLDRVRTS
ncbi:MAG: alpha/beta hydrolase [Ilumatobacter sp.]|uniref:alpha/beta hydrolase n=1 Tax=Ilumatobacter sp. TaxID=1967498 RepID=UPI0026105853|nr:alpha/beta fold hydrolase [Ilumatobacter sp.]MDJ0768362.1 alpha/beta hydrolase [Ilumatobacter sp.]